MHLQFQSLLPTVLLGSIFFRFIDAVITIEDPPAISVLAPNWVGDPVVEPPLDDGLGPPPGASLFPLAPTVPPPPPPPASSSSSPASSSPPPASSSPPPASSSPPPAPSLARPIPVPAPAVFTIDCTGIEEICQNHCFRMACQLPKTPLDGIYHRTSSSKESSKNRRRGCCGLAKCNTPSAKFDFYSAASTAAWRAGEALNCDEFPYAGMLEGGADTTCRCVPETQNSAHGQQWNAFLNLNDGYAKKNGIRIRLINKPTTGSCAKIPTCDNKDKAQFERARFVEGGIKLILGSSPPGLPPALESDSDSDDEDDPAVFVPDPNAPVDVVGPDEEI
ncbi:MAG: hypothetical protein M1817_001342 [Caeruleum heppii]|nr:MAG: hypothetical protein M1817_001342 [Caeruleum heppii]